jgi:hypothetical protein
MMHCTAAGYGPFLDDQNGNALRGEGVSCHSDTVKTKRYSRTGDSMITVTIRQ